MEKFMNQHVNRRSIMGASVGLAIAMPSAAVAAATAEVGSANLPTLAAGVSPELQALKKAFDRDFRKFEKVREVWDAAEQAYLDIMPPRPEHIVADFEKSLAYIAAKGRGQQIDQADVEYIEEITRANKERKEAWEAADEAAKQQSGFADADAAYGRQHWLTSLAANRILGFKARSFDDVKVKLQLHRKWGFDIGRLVPKISADINLIAKAQRQSVSRGTTAVTA